MQSAERNRLFKEIAQAHQAAIRRICRAYLYDRNATDDLCQEVLLNVWRQLDRFEGRASWATYLYRITVNTVINHNRRARPTLPLEHAPETIDESEQTLAREASVVRRREELQRAVSQLPPVDRIIIALVLEDLSYQHISEITGLAPGHVGVRINRAKAKLRQLLRYEQQPCPG